jgi:hypothetical protein
MTRAGVRVLHPRSSNGLSLPHRPARAAIAPRSHQAEPRAQFHEGAAVILDLLDRIELLEQRTRWRGSSRAGGRRVSVRWTRTAGAGRPVRAARDLQRCCAPIAPLLQGRASTGFEAFVFGNPYKFYTEANPRFFEGTQVEAKLGHAAGARAAPRRRRFGAAWWSRQRQHPRSATSREPAAAPINRNAPTSVHSHEQRVSCACQLRAAIKCSTAVIAQRLRFQFQSTRCNASVLPDCGKISECP